jgi:geranylgeranyl diphosphate synthase type II
LSTARRPRKPLAAEPPDFPAALPPESRDPVGPKRVPAARADRERIRVEAAARVARLDPAEPLGRSALESHSRRLLADLGFDAGYLGWTMVAVASAFWRPQVQTIPCRRRVLLLPHCLRDSQTCAARYGPLGLLCEDCGACRLTDLRSAAERQGYRVLIAEGSPVVLDLILHGQVDAILGAACLNSLEKAFDKILLAGVPCMAVPLLNNSCRDTATDVDWVQEMIDTPYVPGRNGARSYLHLLRLATRLFEPDELERLLPRARGEAAPSAPSVEGASVAPADPADIADPIAVTEAIARDFLARGGKHFRPFVTLAAYDAMTGGAMAAANGARAAGRIPDHVRRVAMAIETFHKASLVHDDIEDDDAFRYGQPALHRRYGAATAINVGDYLIGLGYRLVAAQRGEAGADVAADILARLSDAHIKLCEGQGAEFAWRDRRRRQLAPLEALKIYALKTSPAFEVALWAGLRLAGESAELDEPVARFSRHLGVGFQILNDLDDWQRDPDNKRTVAADALAGRPTILWALALARLPEADGDRLRAMVAAAPADLAKAVEQVRALYQQADVFEQARQLVAKHRLRAHEIADAVACVPLARLLHYLADTILRG